MFGKTGLYLVTGLSILANGAAAQTAHDHSIMHSSGNPRFSLSEPGQGAFAAVSEVVAMLLDDPATDWSKVDIAGLRRHLLDMDNLITHAVVEEIEIEHGLEMRIAIEGEGGAAALRMVPAHAPVLASETGWTSTTSRTGDTITWRVSDPDSATAITALGFFGLMAVGDHHRDHHLGLAQGKMAH